MADKETKDEGATLVETGPSLANSLRLRGKFEEADKVEKEYFASAPDTGMGMGPTAGPVDPLGAGDDEASTLDADVAAKDAKGTKAASKANTLDADGDGDPATVTTKSGSIVAAKDAKGTKDASKETAKG